MTWRERGREEGPPRGPIWRLQAAGDDDGGGLGGLGGHRSAVTVLRGLNGEGGRPVVLTAELWSGKSNCGVGWGFFSLNQFG